MHLFDKRNSFLVKRQRDSFKLIIVEYLLAQELPQHNCLANIFNNSLLWGFYMLSHLHERIMADFLTTSLVNGFKQLETEQWLVSETRF